MTGRLLGVIGLWVLAGGAVTSAEAANTPLNEAIIQCNNTEIKTLIADGADVNARGDRGWRPLQIAATQCTLDIVELLLTKGADIDAADNENSWSALQRVAGCQSCEKSSKEIVALLLARGADVNSKDNYQGTPLHAAARTSRKDVVELLIARGADLNAIDKNGNAPLDIAILELRSRVYGHYGYDKRASYEEVARLIESHVLKQAKNRSELFATLSRRLRTSSDDESARRLIIELAPELKPAPGIPEEARRHFVEGSAIAKVAKNSAQQTLAVQSFTEALRVAPWWADAYYNLGVLQDSVENYNAAEAAFSFYLLSNPKEADRRDVQDRIYALIGKRKLSGVQ
jgi:tetratricopeptide (TPR) repeat protein